MLDQLKKDIVSGKTPVSQALAQVLPVLRGRVTDEKLMWFVKELQGYENSLDYYSYPREFPAYRVVPGQLRMMQMDGTLLDIDTPMSRKEQFFIGAPIAWLEESAQLPNDPTMVEMFGMNVSGRAGVIVCVLERRRLEHILDVVKQSLLALIDAEDLPS